MSTAANGHTSVIIHLSCLLSVVAHKVTFSTWTVLYWQCSTIVYHASVCVGGVIHTYEESLWGSITCQQLHCSWIEPEPESHRQHQQARELKKNVIITKSSLWSSHLWPLINTVLQILLFNWGARACENINRWDNPVFYFFFPPVH